MANLICFTDWLDNKIAINPEAVAAVESMRDNVMRARIFLIGGGSEEYYIVQGSFEETLDALEGSNG